MSVPDDPYPEIGQIVARSTPKPWDRVVLEVRLWDGAARFKALKYEGDRWSGVSLSDPSRLRGLFERVQEITQEVGAPTTPRWQTATFTLKSDGEFDVQFGYEEGATAHSPQQTTGSPSQQPKRPWWRFWGK